MKHFFDPTCRRFLPRLAAGLGACLIAAPLMPACAQDEAIAPIIDTSPAPKAGQDFPIQAPAAVPIPATSAPIPAGALFAAPDAKADSDGKAAAAPTTFEQALKTAPEGGTIILRGGTYRAGKIFLPRRLTLQAYPGESPWFKGSVIVSGGSKTAAGGGATTGRRSLRPKAGSTRSLTPIIRWASTAIRCSSTARRCSRSGRARASSRGSSSWITPKMRSTSATIPPARRWKRPFTTWD